MNLQQYRLWHQQFVGADKQRPKPLVMGIVNVTPDSFYDGGKYSKKTHAIQHARLLVEKGADILDIGGESSRPCAEPVSSQLEMDRILPVIQAIRHESDIMISVDTSKANVMHESVKLGANLINDISGLPDQITRKWLANTEIPVCLMHMQGTPKTMQTAPHYTGGIVSEVQQFLQKRIGDCISDGIKRENIIIDPGFGFGKLDAHNLLMLQQVKQFTAMPFPVLLGVSRKNTLGKVTGCGIENRLSSGLAATIYSQMQGVGIHRTHDVAETVSAITMLDAIIRQKEIKDVRE